MPITFEKTQAARRVMEVARKLVNLKGRQLAAKVARERDMRYHDRLAGEFQKSMQRVLVPFLQQQVHAATKELERKDGGTYTANEASVLGGQIFNARSHDADLVQMAAGPVAKYTAQVLMDTALQFRDDLNRHKSFGFAGTGRFGVKCGGPGSGKPGPCPTLSHEELSAIREWSHTLYRETAPGVRMSDSTKQKLRTLDTAIEKLPHYSGKIYRTIVVDNINAVEGAHGGLKKNNLFVADRPLSASKSPAEATEFGTSAAMAHQTVVRFNIHSKTGADISKHVAEEYRDQQEVLVRPGSRFVIDNIVRGKGSHGGKLVDVELREVDPWRNNSQYLHSIGALSKNHRPAGTKVSSAAAFLESLGGDSDDLEEVEFNTPYGKIKLKLAVDYPDWMKEEIQERLNDTFSQPYWKGINDTTAGDINGLLERGLVDGLSIRDMAKQMADQFGSDYPLSRGMNIARTEAGNALNGARTASFDKLIEELGLGDSVKKMWLSVLGNTTRDAHAHNDGVPADKNGLWYLNGIACRWPGDVSLPPGDRCNCQCTTTLAFGMQNDEAAGLIEDHAARVAAGKAFDDTLLKASTLSGNPSGSACGAGAPGHQGFLPGNTCHSGGAKKPITTYQPGVVGSTLGVSTHGWKADGANAQWTMKKIHQLEELAKAGKWAEGKKAFYTGSNYPQKYLDAIKQAQENFEKLYDKSIGKLPTGAVPVPAKPEVASGVNWKQVGPQLGTEKGGQYEMGGKKYYVKMPDDENRVRNELIGLKLYELGGGTTVKGALVNINGKTALATEWEDMQKANWNSGDHKVAAQGDFALHAWLNNRDAVGAGSENPMDNIRITKDGKAKLIDAGGALDYSGMGGSGKKKFDDFATEWDTLRDPSKNPTMAKVFGDMTAHQLVESASKLSNITTEQVAHIVNTYHKGTANEKQAMINTLMARRDSILAKAEHVKNVQKEIEDALAKKQAEEAAAAAKPVLPKIDHPWAGDQEWSWKKNWPKIDLHGTTFTVPPPPNYLWGSKANNPAWISFQNKWNTIHEALKKGDLATIQAIKVKFNAKDPDVQALHKYKTNAIVAIVAAKAAAEHAGLSPNSPAALPKTSPNHVAPAPALKPSFKIDPSRFPEQPQFVSSNAEQNAQKAKAVTQALDFANKGDLEGLKAMALPPSPKLQAWHSTLIDNVAHQLNPPPKPATIHHDYADHAEGIHPKKSGSLGKVGFWTKHGMAEGVPAGKPKENWINGTSQQYKLHEKGQALAKKLKITAVAKNHTGQSYGPMNDSLRGNGNSSYYENAAKLSSAIVKDGMLLPEGITLSRKHSGVDHVDWKKVAPGTVISDKAMLSTSMSQSVWGGNTHIRMTLGPGVRGLPVDNFSNHQGENEIILGSNQRMLVTHIEKGTYNDKHCFNCTTVHVLVLPTLPDQCCPP